MLDGRTITIEARKQLPGSHEVKKEVLQPLQTPQQAEPVPADETVAPAAGSQATMSKAEHDDTRKKDDDDDKKLPKSTRDAILQYVAFVADERKKGAEGLDQIRQFDQLVEER